MPTLSSFNKVKEKLLLKSKLEIKKQTNQSYLMESEAAEQKKKIKAIERQALLRKVTATKFLPPMSTVLSNKSYSRSGSVHTGTYIMKKGSGIGGGIGPLPS